MALTKLHKIIIAAVAIVVVIVGISLLVYFLAIKPNQDKEEEKSKEPRDGEGRLVEYEDNDDDDGGGDKDFYQVSLSIHNKYRKKHHADPLKLSDELNELADKCALHYVKKGTIDHSCGHKALSTGMQAGENLYMGMHPSTSDPSYADDREVVKKGTKAWYDEVKDYDFKAAIPSNFPEVGHFTQLVWRASRELGVGIARKGNIVVMTALYSPLGNFNNDFQANVLPP